MLSRLLPWLLTGTATVVAYRLSRARERDRAAWRQSEARVRALVDRAAYGIYTATPDGRFLDANHALAAMLGYDSVAELLRADLAALYAEPTMRVDLLRQVEDGTLPDWVDVQWLRRDGTPITVRLSARGERDASGRLRRCEGIVEDVTMRLRREAAQRRAERLASLGRMLAGTAHELNNPLAAVSGFSQLLLRTELTDDVRHGLETIDREANRAAAVVKDLLAFSRGDGDGAGGGARSRVADLNAVARYVAHARRYALETRGVQVRLELATGPLFVAADRAQLEQVVLNLVSNAEQALEPMADAHAQGGGDTPTVVVRTRRRGGLATVEVADNGPGIAPADLPLVWDPFWTTKRGGEGTGLGLAVVHEIVSRLGGEADVESEPGAGAQFRITLPAVEPPAAVDDTGDGESLAESARQPLDVLVVDADREAAAFVTRLLSSRGHAVVATHAADDALALVAQGADVVLLTATLAADTTGSSNGDARPLLDRLRAAAGAGAPRMVVVTDGDAAPPPLAEGDVVVAKPFDVEQLRRSVEGE